MLEEGAQIKRGIKVDREYFDNEKLLHVATIDSFGTFIFSAMTKSPDCNKLSLHMSAQDNKAMRHFED